MDVEIGITGDALDLVDTRPYLSTFEDGIGVAGLVRGHSWQDEHDNVGNTTQSPRYYSAIVISHPPHFCPEGARVRCTHIPTVLIRTP